MAGNKEFFIVYRHIRLDTNEIFYVGIGKNEKRAFDKTGRNRHWKHITNKTQYKVEIITTVDSWDNACELEVLLIKEYGRRDLKTGSLVNMTDGGEGTQGIIVSDETKKKQSEAKTGKKSNNYGNPHSDKVKLRLSLVNKGKVLSQETKDKMSQKRLGKKFSKEHIENIKNSSTCSKKLINTETGDLYKSISECARLVGIKRTTLNAMLTGQIPNKTNLIYLKDYGK